MNASIPSAVDRLVQNLEDFDCLKLDNAVEEKYMPSLLRAIRANRTVKSAIIQLPFPLDLKEDHRRQLLEAIAELPQLTRLNIEYYNLSQRDLDAFVTAMQRTRPPLEEFCMWDLQLEGEDTALDPLVMMLSSLSTLEKVALGVDNNERGCPVLSESSLVVLSTNQRLMSLRLANMALNFDRVALLTEALELNGALKNLELHGEELTRDGWVAIAHLLEKNDTLEKFSLFDFKGMDDDGARALSNALTQNQTLQSLSVENDDDCVSKHGNIVIAQMLQQNAALRCFCFSSRGLSDDVFVAYAEALETNRSLVELELGTYGGGGKVSNRGVTAMANMLPHNNALEKLCMCCQQGLDDNGAIAIASALQHNNTLKHLLLEDGDDAVTHRGYEALVEMLQQNTVLETMYNENSGNLKLKIDYYLKLNQLGLRSLLLNVNATRAQFLDAVVSNHEDLDCLYYMISMNPSFVSECNYC